MWAFFTKLGFDVGVTGAAFECVKVASRYRRTGSFWRISSEDLHLGNTLYKMDYKLVLGPLLSAMLTG